MVEEYALIIPTWYSFEEFGEEPSPSKVEEDWERAKKFLRDKGVHKRNFEKYIRKLKKGFEDAGYEIVVIRNASPNTAEKLKRIRKTAEEDEGVAGITQGVFVLEEEEKPKPKRI